MPISIRLQLTINRDSKAYLQVHVSIYLNPLISYKQ